MTRVVLVDEDDRAIGTAEKMQAHVAPGLLHRAISVFLLDGAGRVLLQQRADEKHHFRGRWSNTCCTHPLPGEDVVAAGERRLREEMGCRAELTSVGSFLYHATDEDSGLVERELDHVLVGYFNGVPKVNPAEVQAWELVEIASLSRDLKQRPRRYTPWLARALVLATELGRPHREETE